MPRPLILIHGYSDNSDSFKRWIDGLKAIYKNDQSFSVHLCDYRTLTNEISLKDIAEGFDRALRHHPKLSKEAEFDVIVHSTGMLVIRTWLTVFDSQRRYGRLKHLVALAPATFGSPLAKKGRSWLGAIFKGKRQWGPDFMEAGDLVLDALELGSAYVWDLAHKDLLSPKPVYGPDSDTPFVFSFCGIKSYGFIADLVTDEDGTDGTVRWSGCALNTRKIMIDLSVDEKDRKGERVTATPWSNIDDIPFIPVDGCHHGSILTDPPDKLVNLVASALKVSDMQSYKAWHQNANEETGNILADQAVWQQFIVRVVDERGDPIPDYYIQLYTETAGEMAKFREFAMDVDTYSKDHSYRCFHVNLSELKKNRLGTSDEEGFNTIENLWIRIMATTGTRLIGYTGYGADNLSFLGESAVNRPGDWDAKIEIPTKIKVKSKKKEDVNEEISFFYPFTTTLVEIKLNREPFPFGLEKINSVATIDHHLENRDE